MKVRSSMLLTATLLISAAELCSAQDATHVTSSAEVSLVRIKTDSVSHEWESRFQQIESTQDSIIQLANASLSSIRNKFSDIEASIDSSALVRKIDSILTWKNRKLATVTRKADSLRLYITKTIDEIPLSQELRTRSSNIVSGLERISVLKDTGADFNVNSILGKRFSNIESIIPDDHLRSGATEVLEAAEMKGLSSVSEIAMSRTNAQVLTEQVSALKATGSVERVVDMTVDGGQMATLTESVQEQISESNQLVSMIDKAGDAENSKQQLLKEVRHQALDHFAGKQAQLEAAIDKLAKYKDKFENAPDISKLPRRPPNPMRDKKFAQRLMPGLSVQIARRDDWLVDFNPYLGFWFTAHIVGGAGWNQRLGYTNASRNLNNSAAIYGPRIYCEYSLVKGFSVRVEAEFMSVAKLSTTRNVFDDGNRSWNFGAFGGIKKSYRLVKSVQGTAMVLYSVDGMNYQNFGKQRIAIRIGIEIPQRNKAK